MTAIPAAATSGLPPLFFADEMERPYPCVFAYAAAGVGKTNSIRTLEEMESLKGLKPLVLATEDGQTKGTSTLGDLHYPVIPINSLEQLVSVTAELASKAKPGQLFYQGHGPFGMAVADSVTGISYFLEQGAIKLKGWSMIWDSSAGSGKDPRQAYPYIAERGRQVVRKLMELPAPLLLLCREQNVTEGEGKTAITYAAPEIAGQKLPKELPGWPEATVRLRMFNGNERVMMTENEGNVIARVRLKPGLRLPKMCKPHMGALFDLLITGDPRHIERLKTDGQKAQEAKAKVDAAGTKPTAPLPAVQQTGISTVVG